MKVWYACIAAAPTTTCTRKNTEKVLVALMIKGLRLDVIATLVINGSNNRVQAVIWDITIVANSFHRCHEQVPPPPPPTTTRIGDGLIKG